MSADDWRSLARCKGADTEMFFSGEQSQIDAAIKLCSTCQVRDECLDDAILQGDDEYGIRGGLRQGERRRIVKQDRKRRLRLRRQQELLARGEAS